MISSSSTNVFYYSSNSSGGDTDEHESKVPTEIFTKEEEISLLKQIQEHKQSLCICICKFCSIDRLKRLVYRVACEKKKLYPQSWDEEQQAGSEWLEEFEKRHKDEFSKFPLTFKLSLSRASTSKGQPPSEKMLTFKEEQSLFAHIKINKTQMDCICQMCIYTHILCQLSKLIRDGTITYPETWNTEETRRKWFEDFSKRHEVEISKFPTLCIINSFRTWELSSPQVFTLKEERSLLMEILTDINRKISETNCICQKCIQEIVPFIAYIRAYDKRKNYIESWHKNEKAGKEWMEGFIERHKAELSILSSTCNLELSQQSTSEGQSTCSQILTSDEKQLVLTDVKTNKQFSPLVFTLLEEISLLERAEYVKNRFDCNCKSCLIEELQVQAYILAHQCQISYPPSCDKNRQANVEWLTEFQKRHKDRLSKFQLKCTIVSSQRKPRSSIFTLLEEQLLLTLIEHTKSTFDCKCKQCLMQEIQFRAYKLARKYRKLYPDSWNKDQQADSKWRSEFEKRHRYRLSLLCKIDV